MCFTPLLAESLGSRSSAPASWCAFWEAVPVPVFHLALCPPSLPLSVSQLAWLASLKEIICYFEIPQHILAKGYPPKNSR